MAYSLVQGDLLPSMQIQLAAPAAIAALPTALQVQMLWLRPDGTFATVSLSVVDPINGVVQRTWAPGDSSIVGLHQFQVQVTASNGETATDPNDGTFSSWWVYAPLSGAAPVPTPPVILPGAPVQGQLTCGDSAVASGAPVYINGNGTFARAEANAQGTAEVIGLTAQSVTNGQLCYIIAAGPLTLATTLWDAVVIGESGGLTPNAFYYLSDTQLGMLVIGPGPSTPGHYSTLVGRAWSTTTMLVNPQPPIFL